MKRFFLIFVLALLVFSACSNKENSLNENQQKENTDSEYKQTETTNQKTETNQKNFGDFFSKMPKMPEYKVVYSIKNSLDTTELKQTMVFKGQNFKYEMQGNTVYLINKKTYMCITQGSVMCYELKGQQEENIKTDLEFRNNWQNYNIKELPSRTIAGAKTRCFGYTLNSFNQEICYSDEFVPLYLKSEAPSSSIEMIALEYSNKVSDSEFELPAEPQQFDLI